MVLAVQKTGNFVDGSIYLEDDECKSARAPGVGVGLQVDVVDLAVLAEVLLDVQVLCLLGEAAHKQLAIILAEVGPIIFGNFLLVISE